MLDTWRTWATVKPNARALTYLADGEDHEITLTYAQLDQKARSIAAFLQEHLRPGDRSLMLYPPGLDFVTAFMGCLYAGVVAVPAHPPDPVRLSRSLPLLRNIVRDARVSVVLTTAAALAPTQGLVSDAEELKTLRWVATDTPSDHATDWRAPQLDGDSLAFLQYTSGSTGAPRGVMVSHGNLLHNEHSIQTSFHHREDELIGVGWLPLYHDMGLIGMVLQALYVGGSVTSFSPRHFLENPIRWLRAITRYRATSSGGPNFGYELCLRRIGEAERATLDLSSWKVAYVGAEPVRAQTLDRFARTFASCGFRREALYPCYGLAESTLMVSGGWLGVNARALALSTEGLAQGRALPVEAGDLDAPMPPDATPTARELVSSGEVTVNHEIVIVDPHRRVRCSPDQIGEIWVGGPSVAQGYWNRPEDTAETFAGRLADTGEGPFLRTGDLGFLREGQIFVTGRHKDVLIIRGRNLYPQDIELSVERSHGAVRRGCVAAFPVDVGTEERLVVVAELDPKAETTGEATGVMTTIRQAVTTEHEIQAHAVVLIKAGSLLKTSSGKVQRRACKAAFLDRALEVVATWQRVDEGADHDAPAYVKLGEHCSKIDLRSTTYRFDLERDVRWDRLDSPGLHFGPAWLDAFGIDATKLERVPSGHALYQWALALSVGEGLIAGAELFLQFIRQETPALGPTRSLVLLRDEEVKHVELFRRYGAHLRALRPDWVATFNRHFAPCEALVRRQMENLLARRPAARHYVFWLHGLLLEEHSVYIHDRMLADASLIQPAWLSAHTAHRQEKVQHLVTARAHVQALTLTSEERLELSRSWFRSTAPLLGRFLGFEAAHLLLQDAYPELAKELPDPVRAHPRFLAALLHERAFSRTRECAPYLAHLAGAGEDLLREELGSLLADPGAGAEPAVVGPTGAPILGRLRSASARTRRALVLEYLGDQIASISKELPSGPETHLLTLGLDSLTIVELSTKVQADLGVAPPLDQLLDATLGDLADDLLERIALDGDESQVRPTAALVEIHPRGAKSATPAIFCVGGAQGTALYLVPLARALGSAQPFYSFQAPGLDGRQRPVSRVEDLAVRYREEIQEVQPHGPYVLFGHSFGGLVAYEIAQQLRRANEEVAHVVLFDSLLAKPGLPQSKVNDAVATFLLSALFAMINGTEMTSDQGDILDQSPADLLKRLRDLSMVPAGFPVGHLVEVCRAHIEASDNYAAAPPDFEVSLFSAEELPSKSARRVLESRYTLDDRGLGWERVCGDRLRVIRARGDHVTMLTTHVGALAEQVTRYVTSPARRADAVQGGNV